MVQVWRPVRYPVVDPRNYGAKCDGITDDTAAFTAAFASLGSSARRRIALPPTAEGLLKITSTLQINTRGLVIEGERGSRPAQEGGSQISYTGTGPLFQLDEDNGNPHSDADYDGVQGFTLKDVELRHTAPATALGNGQGNYKAGSYGIRDWRGGDIHLERVRFENFDYGFWGVQSDINRFINVEAFYNKVACYLGPRSDQAMLTGWYAFYNDTVLHLDGVLVARVRDGQFVGNGTDTLYPVKIGTSWSRGSQGIVFDGMWFEHFQGYNGVVPAFVSIGDGDTVASTDIAFRDNWISCDAQTETRRVTYFVETDAADRITVDGVAGFGSNLKKIFGVNGADTTNLYLTAPNAVVRAPDNTVHDTLGLGTANVHTLGFGSARHEFRSQNGRLFVGKNPPVAGDDFYISSEGAFAFQVTTPGKVGGGSTTLLRFDHRVHPGTAAPTSNSWDQGDRILNTAPSELGSGGSKYVVTGWICTVAGTPGTWLEMRTLTGN